MATVSTQIDIFDYIRLLSSPYSTCLLNRTLETIVTNVIEKREYLETYESYLRDAFGDIKLMRDALLKRFDPDSFDTLVGTGLSGALVVPRLADMLGKHWAIVRKPYDVRKPHDGSTSHSSNLVEGRIGHSWLFVDDQRASGRTERRVIEAISDIARSEDFPTKHVGTFLYLGSTTQTTTSNPNQCKCGEGCMW